MNKKAMKSLIVTSVSLFSATGCTTTGASTAAGAGVGAVLGGTVGMAVDPGAKGRGRIKNVVVGSLGGAALGAAAGYLTGNSLQSSQESAFAKGQSTGETKISDQMANTGGEPELAPPKVEVHFVEDMVRGSTFVPAHFEYRIVEPARWKK